MTSRTNQEHKAPKIRARMARRERENPERLDGKMGGRTFGVQSLRKNGPSCAVASVGLGPEVLLSLLPRSKH